MSLNKMWLLLLYMAGYGIGQGLTSSLWVVVVIETVGIDEYVHVLGAFGITMAILYLGVGPAFGMH